MELSELVALRPVPCAGVLLMVTQRCPLRCAHCSTSSTMAGAQADGAALLRLVESFGPADRPELVMLTGGEPLLRPGLVTTLAEAARARGVRTALLSGMFFARGGRLPASIRRAANSVDHFSASIDREHEREVPRSEVLRVLAALLDDGTAVSLHITGLGDDDPYLAEVTREVRGAFGDRIPMLVNKVRAVGRAAAWTQARDRRPSARGSVPPVARDGRVAAAVARPAPDGGRAAAPDRAPGAVPALPCAMAAWPVVAPDGVVLACGNQDAVDLRPPPEHLLLGHIHRDAWQTIRRRALESPELRMIRALGPLHLRSRFGSGEHTPGAHGAGVYEPGPSAAGAYEAGAYETRSVDAGAYEALPVDAETRDAGAPEAGTDDAGAHAPQADDASPYGADGYCAACVALPRSTALREAVRRYGAGPAGELLDVYAARTQARSGPVALVRRFGCARYAGLVAPGGSR